MRLQGPSDCLIILLISPSLCQDDDIDAPQKGQILAEALPNQALYPIPGNSRFYVFLGDCKTQAGMADCVGPHQNRKNPIRRFARSGEHERIVGRLRQSTALGKRVIVPLFTCDRHPGTIKPTCQPVCLFQAVQQRPNCLSSELPHPGPSRPRHDSDRGFLFALNRQSRPSFRPTRVNHTPPSFGTHSCTKAMGSGPFDPARLKCSLHDLYPAIM